MSRLTLIVSIFIVSFGLAWALLPYLQRNNHHEGHRHTYSKGKFALNDKSRAASSKQDKNAFKLTDKNSIVTTQPDGNVGIDQLQQEASLRFKVKKNRDDKVSQLTEGSINLSSNNESVTAEHLVAEFLSRYGKELFGVKSARLVVTLQSSTVNGEPLTVLTASQVIDGLSIYNAGKLKFVVQNGNELVHVNSDAIDEDKWDVPPVVFPADQADDLAWSRFQAYGSTKGVAPQFDRQDVGKYRQTMVYRNDHDLGVVYRYHAFVHDSVGDYEVLVDAEDGRVFRERPLSR